MDPAAWRFAFVIPALVGLVELARRAGVGPLASSVLGLVLGLGVRLAYAAAMGGGDLAAWLDATIQGLLLEFTAGLAAQIRHEPDEPAQGSGL